MKALIGCRMTPLRTRFASRADSSRTSASWSTATSGPFPERKTARDSPKSRRRVATSSPTNVFPAPGTPVTKTIAFRPCRFAPSIMLSTAAEVTLRFVAPASWREIASTECCEYRERAASMIVGVGWYGAFPHSAASKGEPWAMESASLTAAPIPEVVHRRGGAHPVRMFVAPAGVSPNGFRCNEQRKDRCIMTGAMKVLQIQRVVPNLVVMGRSMESVPQS